MGKGVDMGLERERKQSRAEQSRVRITTPAQPTTPHTPYSAAAVPGIDSIFTFLTIYFEIQTGVTHAKFGEDYSWARFCKYKGR